MNESRIKISDILYITNEYLGHSLNETDAHDVLNHFKFVTGDFYKIVLLESRYGYLATLKHSYPHPDNEKQRTRQLIIGRWIKSVKKVVTDGGLERDTKYLSGWHIFQDFHQCRKYAQKFKNDVAIITVKAKGIRKKEHSKAGVYLADEIFVLPESLIINKPIYKVYK